MEHGMEGIRIYNKLGGIAFSDDVSEIGGAAHKNAEQCYVCHGRNPPRLPLRLRTGPEF